MLSNWGLILIILGWLYQLGWLYKNQKEIQTGFLALYGSGLLLLILDGFYNNLFFSAWLNIFVLLIVFLMWLKISKR